MECRLFASCNSLPLTSQGISIKSEQRLELLGSKGTLAMREVGRRGSTEAAQDTLLD